MWTKRTVLSCFFVFAFMAAAGSATAQSHSVGIRGGVSVEPDQVYLGAHVDLKEISNRFWFRPNAELGLGSGATVVALNGEFVYKLRAVSKEWTPYLGADLPSSSDLSEQAPMRETPMSAPDSTSSGASSSQRGFLPKLRSASSIVPTSNSASVGPGNLRFRQSYLGSGTECLTPNCLTPNSPPLEALKIPTNPA